MYVLTVEDGLLVHEIGPSGEVVRSFGEAAALPATFPTEGDAHLDEVLKDYSAMGSFLCDEEAQVIALVAYNLPNVRVWSPDGALLLDNEIPNYSQARMNRQGGSYSLVPDPETERSTAAISLFGIDGKHLGLQALEAGTSPSSSDGANLRSFIVDLSDRSVHELEVRLPRIRAYRDGLAYASEESPFPRVWQVPIEFRWIQ